MKAIEAWLVPLGAVHPAHGEVEATDTDAKSGYITFTFKGGVEFRYALDDPFVIKEDDDPRTMAEVARDLRNGIHAPDVPDVLIAEAWRQNYEVAQAERDELQRQVDGLRQTHRSVQQAIVRRDRTVAALRPVVEAAEHTVRDGRTSKLERVLREFKASDHVPEEWKA